MFFAWADMSFARGDISFARFSLSFASGSNLVLAIHVALWDLVDGTTSGRTWLEMIHSWRSAVEPFHLRVSDISRSHFRVSRARNPSSGESNDKRSNQGPGNWL